ncbi:hypothetical protein SYNTR_0972 [Candidatus Syntrophocurvum alkaliphilum]|uniref:Uncharacterized protein n=1 Tax=Candidatus Syntrophocurvum alkaliphilum TaxID=2293317 RepID=A0A6I6D9W3_9FIRM|nr:hypothetical protein [Candidatus Syntrophocurvum alkaliphilum]QGT99565.1 hypothetical protein SYNTR_0972 [Candidatus Syntrophocurvum alkaliphilum]
MLSIKNKIKVLICCIIFIFIIFIPNEVSANTDKPINNVFLISVDGLNYEGYVSMSTPNIDYFAQTGAFDEKAMAVRADTLEAGEASLLTGVFPNHHKHLTANDKVEVESLLDVLKKNQKSIMIVDGSGGKLKSFDHGHKKYIELDESASNKEVLDTLYDNFVKEKTFFNYAYLSGCKEALLKVDQDEYYEEWKDLDNQLAVFLKRLKDGGYYSKSLIILTSSRSSSPSDYVPLIIVGPNTKSNTKIEGSLIIDVAPTIASYIGLEKPYNSRGIALYNTYVVSEDTQKEVNSKWIEQLQQDRINNWVQYYKIADELDRTIRQLNSIKEEKESIFDFFGEKEQTIAKLKAQIWTERGIFAFVILVMGIGYLIEYKWLKRKFLLFK